MKVSVAALSRFHSFDLAEQLRQRRLLRHLFTGYPQWNVPDLLRPYTRTFPWLAVPYHLAGRYRQEWLQKATHLASVRTFDAFVARSINFSPPDVLHIWASYGAETTQKAKSLGITTICDRGSTHILAQQATLEAEYLKWGINPPALDRRIGNAELGQYRLSDAITVPSSQAQETFHDYGLNPFVVPYGVDLDRFTWQRHVGSRFIVLFVGALSIRKGVPLIVQAFHKWRVPNAEVWLVGTILNEVNPWIRELPPHIKVLGPVPQKRLPDLFAQASVLLLPSCEEGLALVLGQALASGLPIIASKETGAEELISNGEHGYILRERTALAIRFEVETLYCQPKVLQRMRENVRALRPQLTWAKYANKMVGNYDRLLHEVAEKTTAAATR